eukprot:scaffold266362_cov14-Prasinocladus_malaysianus.AAC.1
MKPAAAAVAVEALNAAGFVAFAPAVATDSIADCGLPSVPVSIRRGRPRTFAPHTITPEDIDVIKKQIGLVTRERATVVEFFDAKWGNPATGPGGLFTVLSKHLLEAAPRPATATRRA